jgi:hypothetical protein
MQDLNTEGGSAIVPAVDAFMVHWARARLNSSVLAPSLYHLTGVGGDVVGTAASGALVADPAREHTPGANHMPMSRTVCRFSSSGSLAMLAAMIYPEPEKAVGERLRNPLSFRFTPRPFLKPAPFSLSPGRSLRRCATAPGRRRAKNRRWSRASTSRSLLRGPSGPFNSVDSLFEHTSLALQICIR